MNPKILRAAAGVFAAGLAIAGIAAEAQNSSAADRPAIPYHFFCRSNKQMGQTFYFSTTQPAKAGTGRQDLVKAFRAHISKKYNYPNTDTISCVFSVTGEKAPTESTRLQTIDNLKNASFDVVIESDWTYGK